MILGPKILKKYLGRKKKILDPNIFLTSIYSYRKPRKNSNYFAIQINNKKQYFRKMI